MEIRITPRAEELLRELAGLVAAANRRYFRQRWYIYENSGYHVHVYKRGWVYDGFEDVVPIDTRCTEENLQAAVAAMRRELKEINQ